MHKSRKLYGFAAPLLGLSLLLSACSSEGTTSPTSTGAEASSENGSGLTILRQNPGEEPSTDSNPANFTFKGDYSESASVGSLPFWYTPRWLVKSEGDNSLVLQTSEPDGTWEFTVTYLPGVSIAERYEELMGTLNTDKMNLSDPQEKGKPYKESKDKVVHIATFGDNDKLMKEYLLRELPDGATLEASLIPSSTVKKSNIDLSADARIMVTTTGWPAPPRNASPEERCSGIGLDGNPMPLPDGCDAPEAE